ncbi:Protein-methionine-sulfoxide reductase catalytic subunit MsrP [Rhodovastum atsumiense]|uniref:Protein-methionine-sulfoxide reductase catalytic subunit MsrP n=1 Tax=Rhodovastum atsumiense TaxID=504468 RepID=A0A5M6INT6_9PROT|nr:protein-methionine-sulfoxide reductase catalytic subunit MsrP [Rhodovastum atsumiense]KAA5609933.1 protein-methionine-sulfoxide reductase catalytic subunit MsrP [Rhodovastum atsumiense]CAH2604552.1 Protein-methionine-sulfoxide reductase catalytic subunit MsrP [Rhodovastum atsumiense]
MLIRSRRGWEIPETQVTPEAIVTRRRALLGTAGLAAATIATPAQAGWGLFGGSAPPPPRKPLVAPANPAYQGGRPLTPEADATSYNNFYEFGGSKSVARAAQALPAEPWTIELAGLVARPRKLALEDLLKQVSLQERVYRHRCVEAWAMTVPWVGFPLAELVKLAEPRPEAQYLVFTSLADPATMPGLRQSWYPWPYTEGCTLAEATNDLAFLAVGMYGKVIPPQNGAPVRLTLPWKYGFKSAKSIVRVEFTTRRPVSFWERLQDSEYGFWANVNPDVAHPRWSQARERLLGTDEMVPTRIWNGYGEFVAGLYTNLENERLFV